MIFWDSDGYIMMLFSFLFISFDWGLLEGDLVDGDSEYDDFNMWCGWFRVDVVNFLIY